MFFLFLDSHNCFHTIQNYFKYSIWLPLPLNLKKHSLKI